MIKKQKNFNRSIAQPGSALVWGASGRGFKSRYSDQIRKRPLFSGLFFDLAWRSGFEVTRKWVQPPKKGRREYAGFVLTKFFKVCEGFKPKAKSRYSDQ